MKRLSVISNVGNSEWNDENEFNLCRILRAAKLKYGIFFVRFDLVFLSWELCFDVSID